MRRYITFILLLIATHNLSAQFAVINDKDGFVNIRRKPDFKSEPVGKFVEGDAFWCLEESAKDWFNVDFRDAPYNGYIHKSRVKFISEFQSINLKTSEPNKVVFASDSFEIEMQTRRFDKAKNEIQLNNGNVEKINGHNVVGTVGTEPLSEYLTIKLKIGDKRLEFPKDIFEDLYNPDLARTKVNFNLASSILYITAVNSDGAGAYSVAWIFKKEKFVRREIAIPF